MYARKEKDRSRLMKAALQEIPCDLTVSNVRYLNIFTGEIYPAQVDILDGVVVRVREEGQETLCPSREIYDGKDAYLIPGFIDVHMHVESTMMIPEQLSRAILPWGTTTICTDPHEIGNVMGIEGIEFMLENAKKSALRQYVLAPSCVPAVPGLESSGASFEAPEIRALLEKEGVIGIAEIMDFVGVYKDSPRMHSIIDEGLKKNAFLQGHAPTVTGKELCAYRLGGPESDHESQSAAEVREKLRLGMHVNVRGSSLCDVVPDLIRGLDGHRWYDHVSFCTDDVHASDLLADGHVNRVVKRAVAAGMSSLDAIKCATLNAARELGIQDLGAVAPGYLADFQLVRRLDGSRPEAVFTEGKKVAANGVYTGCDDKATASSFKNTVNIPQISSEADFILTVPENYEKDAIEVNVMVPSADKILRTVRPVSLPVKDGAVSLEDHEDLQFVSVVNRYGNGKQVIGVFENFGLREGAFATTITHDSHNLLVVYREPKHALKAVQSLQACGGGICAVKDSEASVLELPVAGLMSNLPCLEIAERIETVQKAVQAITTPETSLLGASIMSLTALPGVTITDFGLVDGISQTLLPVFPSES